MKMTGIRLYCCLLILVALTVNLSHGQAFYGMSADCADVVAQSLSSSGPPSGKYQLNVGGGKRGVWAYCDMETDGGGWTVFQKRSSADQSFYKTWKDYENGFGDVNGDYWLGNTYLNSITVNKRYVLRIEFTDWDNKSYYAEYNNFVVGGAGCKYKLESVGSFCGDCGDSLTPHVGQKFTTQDQDNDNEPRNCAQVFHGAWWYDKCHNSNLNGDYKIGGTHSSYADGINWYTGKGLNYSYKKTEMKIRPYNY